MRKIFVPKSSRVAIMNILRPPLVDEIQGYPFFFICWWILFMQRLLILFEFWTARKCIAKGEFLHGRWKTRGRDELWLRNVNVTFSLPTSFCHFNFFVFVVLSLHSSQSQFFLFSWQWDFYITTHSEKLTTVLQFLPPLAAITITITTIYPEVLPSLQLVPFRSLIFEFILLVDFAKVLEGF